MTGYAARPILGAMDIFTAIEKRHSYRGPYKAGSVPRADLKKILLAAVRAPSGYNEQTTSFVAVDDSEKIRAISEILQQPRIADAPAVVVLCMDLSAKKRRDLYFGVEDYSAACENLLLAATALGYAAVWIDGSLRRDDRARRVAELLDVPDSFEVRVVVPLGVPEESWPQKEKKPPAERVFFNSFGSAG